MPPRSPLERTRMCTSVLEWTATQIRDKLGIKLGINFLPAHVLNINVLLADIFLALIWVVCQRAIFCVTYLTCILDSSIHTCKPVLFLASLADPLSAQMQTLSLPSLPRVDMSLKRAAVISTINHSIMSKPLYHGLISLDWYYSKGSDKI